MFHRAASGVRGAFWRWQATATPQQRKLFTRVLIGGAVGTTVSLGVALASDDALHPPAYDWSHKGFYKAFDTAALRRGFEVYRQVCSTCHSMSTLAYRNLVGVTHTEEQAKMIANTAEVVDGPNDAGEMFRRPAILSDHFAAPYENEQAARATNNGALPPDFSQVSKARHGGEDYVFSLLTGYREPPAGVTLDAGQHFNTYFPGGKIAMAPPLNNYGQIEYEDGTVASQSQMAKDVATFMVWASEPEQDIRKKAGVKWSLFLLITAGFAGWYKRFRWSVHKSRKITWKGL